MTETHECEVLVVGGGSAGIAAAAASARSGAETVLLERYGFLGGQATAGKVGTICGLYLSGADPTPILASGGFPAEWAERLEQASQTHPVALQKGLHVLPYDPWAFQLAADSLFEQTPGATVVLHASLTALERDGGRIGLARALVWNRTVDFLPRTIVDCSGEAVAFHFAGAGVEEGAADQAPAVIFALEGLGKSLCEQQARIALLRAIIQAAGDGRLPQACKRASFVPAASWEDRVHIKIGLPRPEPSDWNAMAKLETQARKWIDALQRFIAAERPELRAARTIQAAIQVGVRGGRRAQGRETLREADVLACRKHEDGVARGAWPIEVWDDSSRPNMAYLPDGDYYEIPIGCLRARELDNVFVAGRCISAEPRAIASARVIGTCLGMGWAAGTAAAFLAQGKPVSEAVERVRGEMEDV